MVFTDIVPIDKRERIGGVKASFIEPMLLERTAKLPEGKLWRYELKWDGYRAIAFKTWREGQSPLPERQRLQHPVRRRDRRPSPQLPDDTVIDGEIVALDENGKPSFNVLQNYGSARAPVLYYVFDVMVLAGKDLRGDAGTPEPHFAHALE